MKKKAIVLLAFAAALTAVSCQKENIAGIEIMDLENAVQALWKEKIYAESGMGCTGPIVLVSKDNIERAKNILADAKFI